MNRNYGALGEWIGDPAIIFIPFDSLRHLAEWREDVSEEEYAFWDIFRPLFAIPFLFF